MQLPDNAIISLSELISRDVPSPGKGFSHLIIYDAAIDKMGHDDELERQGRSPAIERYLKTIERLRDAGWLRILVVTDHGFILWPSSEEKNAPLPAPNPVYKSRRAAAYPASTEFEGPQALAPGGQWRIAVPWGAASFRAYGGLGYFHGGASLQEWIIPCIAITWPMEAKPVDVQIVPIEKILTQRPKVKLDVFSRGLFGETDLPRRVEVLIRDAQQRTILFRSEPLEITPGSGQISVPLAVTEGMVAPRGTKLAVEVRDPNSEEILDSKDSTLMIELTGW